MAGSLREKDRDFRKTVGLGRGPGRLDIGCIRRIRSWFHGTSGLDNSGRLEDFAGHFHGILGLRKWAGFKGTARSMDSCAAGEGKVSTVWKIVPIKGSQNSRRIGPACL
jgi:hypothetical protein